MFRVLHFAIHSTLVNSSVFRSKFLCAYLGNIVFIYVPPKILCTTVKEADAFEIIFKSRARWTSVRPERSSRLCFPVAGHQLFLGTGCGLHHWPEYSYAGPSPRLLRQCAGGKAPTLLSWVIKRLPHSSQRVQFWPDCLPETMVVSGMRSAPMKQLSFNYRAFCAAHAFPRNNPGAFDTRPGHLACNAPG